MKQFLSFWSRAVGLLVLTLLPITAFGQAPFQVRPTSINEQTTEGWDNRYMLTIYTAQQTNVPLTITVSGPDANTLYIQDTLTIYGTRPDTGGYTYAYVPYRFLPTQARLYTAVITVSDGSYSVDIPFRVLVRPRLPYIMVPPFTATVGDTACGWLFIPNPGNTPATITSISIHRPEFQLANAPTLPLVLQANDSLLVAICFIPRAVGTVYDSAVVRLTVGDSSYTIYGQLRGTGIKRSGPCITVDGDTTFTVWEIGQSVERVFDVRNDSDSILIVSAQLTGDLHFRITGPNFPITLDPGERQNVTVQLYSGAPPQQSFYGAIKWSAQTRSGSACDVRTSLVGWGGRDFHLDSAWTPLTSGPKDKLKIEADSGTGYRVFRFYNSTDDTLEILSVSMKKGDDFRASVVFPAGVQSLPMLLRAGESMYIRIDLVNPDPGTHKDELIIELGNRLTTISIEVEGVSGTADVKELDANPVRLHVRTHPVTGPVQISVDNARTVSYEVIGLNGVVLSTLQGVTTTWHPSAELANGVYLIRASGETLDGVPFTITERVVLAR